MNIVHFKTRFITSVLLLILFVLILSSNLFLIYSLLVLGVLSIIEFINLNQKILKKNFLFYLTNALFILFITFFCLIFLYFSNFLQLKIIIFSLLLCCVSSDIGGYIFGNYFKGPKLTKISPKKTISGSVGSIILSMTILPISIFYFTNNVNYKIFIIALITSISCQIGDLIFSYLKRKAKIKDTGNFLPGHGGILDRLDGIFLGLPTGFVSLTLIY